MFALNCQQLFYDCAYYLLNKTVRKFETCLVWCPGQNKRIASLPYLWMSKKVTKGLNSTYT
jgi:hypothetical protein